MIVISKIVAITMILMLIDETCINLLKLSAFNHTNHLKVYYHHEDRLFFYQEL